MRRSELKLPRSDSSGGSGGSGCSGGGAGGGSDSGRALTAVPGLPGPSTCLQVHHFHNANQSSGNNEVSVNGAAFQTH
jgi:hypothetical protein